MYTFLPFSGVFNVLTQFSFRNYKKIPVRRVKDPDNRTVYLAESEETLNSNNELDITRLNIAKPGELYRVCVCPGALSLPLSLI
jgi:hypothetical protein